MIRPERIDGYLPIGDYGLIGDCRSAALVGVDGSIDWLCMPRFDNPSLFGRLLDERHGGHWQIAPASPYQVSHTYRDRTNLLQRTFTVDGGRLLCTDFMPVEAETLDRHAGPGQEPRVIRLVECIGGEAEIDSEVMPAPDYGRARFDGVSSGGRYHADVGDLHICFRSSRPIDGPLTRGRLRVGESVACALVTDERGQCRGPDLTEEHARALLRSTREFWWRWVHGIRYLGPYQQPVWRSALVLKLMTYSPTGAIIAAPTTSLPEAIGKERNWDYRFTWLRDASFTLFAFFQLGLADEAHEFFGWLAKTGIGRKRRVDNLYTLDGGRDCDEHVLEHLAGYRGSRPVRVGNGAASQLQIDVFGEVIDSAYLYARFDGRISRDMWRDLAGIIDLAIDVWQRPDRSIWEPRGPNQHYTYSKIMCWVAVDRGIRLAERFGLPFDEDRWRSARRAIHRRVVADGWSDQLHAFTQTLGGQTLDAALLRLPQVRFLSDHDERVQSTIEAINRRLREGELIRRYRTDEVPDGLEGEEGGFLMCSFWLVDALAHAGRLEEAQRYFEHVLSFGSSLGLFSEEADTKTGDLLGNYPQAFTHLALIGAAVNIERARTRRIGVKGLPPVVA